VYELIITQLTLFLVLYGAYMYLQALVVFSILLIPIRPSIKLYCFPPRSISITILVRTAEQNFFGIKKQEMYYGEPFLSYNELKQKIEEHIYYYSNERIKENLVGLSPDISKLNQPTS